MKITCAKQSDICLGRWHCCSRSCNFFDLKQRGWLMPMVGHSQAATVQACLYCWEFCLGMHVGRHLGIASMQYL